MMRSDAWPQHCRAALVRSVGAAAAQFPGPGEEAPKRVHDVRKTLKEARAIARLFLHCVGEPARVTITTLAATRRQIGRARDLDVMAHARPASRAPARGLRTADGGDRARAGGGSARPSRPLRQHAARAAQRNRQAPRGMGLERGRNRGDCRRGRAHLSAGASAGASLSKARIRSRCMRFALRVVDLRYQLSLLSCAWPEALNAQAEALNDLREALGDFNDLHVLETFAAEHGGLPPQALEGLGARIAVEAEKAQAARQCRVRAAVRRNAERLRDPDRGLSRPPGDRAGGRAG